jgi:L-2,4-diaminobutyrate decarboxylase
LAAPLRAIRSLAEYLDEQADVDLCHWPDTGILCFRIRPDGVLVRELDRVQEFVYRRIMAAGQRSISMTRLDGRTVLRVVAISPAVTAEALRETIADVRRVAAEYPRQVS